MLYNISHIQLIPFYLLNSAKYLKRIVVYDFKLIYKLKNIHIV